MSRRTMPPRPAPPGVRDVLATLNIELRSKIFMDCLVAGMSYEDAAEYTNAVLTYLGIAVSGFADRSSALCSWEPQNGKVSHTFGRQALSMMWDYAEVNPFSSAGFIRRVHNVADALERLPVAMADVRPGVARQADAADMEEQS